MTLKGILRKKCGEVNKVPYIRGLQLKDNIKCTVADNIRQESEVYDYLSLFLLD
jgi:hypothetical protein